MRARLKDLGHDIPLTHAYEMLATSCGFRNWPTMKASLSASTAYTDLGSPHDISVTAGRAVFLNDDGKPWELPESEDWGFELIFGPPGKGKASFAADPAFRGSRRSISKACRTLLSIGCRN
jgi:hypothetical protein